MPQVHRLRFTVATLLLAFQAACSTVSEPEPERHTFPRDKAGYGKPTRPYEVLGVVRTKVNFATLSSKYEESYLCANSFNKAVRDLVRMAQDKGADAVIEVKSVTFLMDGTMEMYEEPQCFDDGAEGQVLVRGTAVKWKPPPKTARSSN